MRNVILLFALTSCNVPGPTMTIEVPEQLRAAQGNIEELVGWIWIFPQQGQPPAPREVEATFADEGGLGALASERLELEGIAAGETRTVDIELAPGDYWVQIWFVDERFEPTEDPLPLLAFASTNALSVAPNEMNEVDTRAEAFFTREVQFDYDDDGESNLDEIVAGTNPYDQLDRTCGLSGPMLCKPTIIHEGVDEPPNGARQILSATEGGPSAYSLVFNHAAANPSDHALTLLWPKGPFGAPEEIDELTTQSNPFADVTVGEAEGWVLWCDGTTAMLYQGGYNQDPTSYTTTDIPKELAVYWGGKSSTLYWSAWDTTNLRTNLYGASAEAPYEPKAPFVVPDPPISGEQEHEDLLLRVAADGTLYISTGGRLWAYDPTGALVGQISPGVTVTDFVADTNEVFSMEYTVLWRHSVTTVDDARLVSDQAIAPPLVQDRDNLYWLSGDRTKIRSLPKNTAGTTGNPPQADDSYNVVMIPNGIRAFDIADDGFAIRTLFLIDEDGQIQRVFL